MVKPDVTAALEAEEALARGAGTPAEEPGDVRVGEKIGGDLGGEVSQVSSAGHRIVYNKLTGDPSVVNNNMMPAILQKTYPDGEHAGQYVFTLKDPGFRPASGTFKCRLHKDDPGRDKWDALGLTTCAKANLKTAYEVQRHMASRHKSEKATIDMDAQTAREAEDKADRQEDRALQHRLLEMLADQAVAKGNKNDSSA